VFVKDKSPAAPEDGGIFIKEIRIGIREASRI
jgi:hypothetical protein